jgi:hypothetical protein
VKRHPARPPRRWLKLRAVADLMQIEHPDRHYRVKFVRRLLQRLEKRDGTAYMRRFGSDPGPGRRGSDWYVSPAALEDLRAYVPTMAQKLREDIDTTTESVTDLRRQVNGHGARIRRLEEFKRKTAEYLASVADL